MPSARGPGRPPAAKAAETRERIVNAARQVFTELGYDAATFQEIAERADLTRPAINHYFKSKRLLWQEVVETTNAKVISRSAQRAFEAKTLLSQLSVLVEVATRVHSEEGSVAAFLVTSVLESQRHPQLRQTENDSLKNTRAFLTWAVTSAIERGELTTSTEVGPLVEILVAMLWGMGFYAGFVGSHQELLTIEEQFLKLCAGTFWTLKSSERPS